MESSAGKDAVTVSEWLVSAGVLVTLGVFGLCHRVWLPGVDGPWWRRSLITRREDLQVGATVLAALAVAVALAATVATDIHADSSGTLRPARAIVLGHHSGATVLQVLHQQPTTSDGSVATVPVGRVALLGHFLGTDIGDVVRVYIGPHRIAATDTSSPWNPFFGISVLLLGVSVGCACASRIPTAGWRFVDRPPLAESPWRWVTVASRSAKNR